MLNHQYKQQLLNQITYPFLKSEVKRVISNENNFFSLSEHELNGYQLTTNDLEIISKAFEYHNFVERIYFLKIKLEDKDIRHIKSMFHLRNITEVHITNNTLGYI